jgi:O-antigen/teichoic acid export membrane protein
VIFCCVTSLLVVLTGPIAGYRGQLRWLLALAALDLMILTPLKYPGLIFQVDLRQWYGVSIGIIRQIVWLLVIIVSAWLKASLFWVILGHALCGVVETGLTLAVSFRFFARPWRFLFAEVRPLLEHAAPLAFATLAISVYHRVDQVLLHRLVDDRELGYYVSAVNLTEVFSALPVAAMASLFPILSQLHDDEERFRQYTTLSFRYLITVAFGMCLLVTLAAHNAIQILYGHDFLRAAPMLSVLIWSEGAIFFGVVMSGALIARNLQRMTLVPAILGAFVNLGVNLFAIPRWGGLGAAWATTISYTIAGVFGFLFFAEARPILNLGLKTFISAACLASILSAGLLLLSSPIILKLLLAGLAYCAGAWQLGLVNAADLSLVWAATGRRVFSASNMNDSGVR